MTASALLQCLTASGLSCRVDGDRLMVSPSNLVTDEIRALVKPCRDELMKLLASAEVPAMDAAILAYFARTPWPAGSAVRLEELDVVTLGDRTVAMPVGQWETFAEAVNKWNEMASIAWRKTKRRS